MTIQMDRDLRYIFDVLPSFGTRYSSLVMGYCQLFGVTPFKLKAKKLRLLLEEMKRLFDAQAFCYGKNQQYQISHAGIAEALDICIKKNFTEHLESHNYLKKIMITISEREGKDKARQGERDLKSRENKIMAGYSREEKQDQGTRFKEQGARSEGQGNEVTDLTPEQIQRNLTRVGNIIKSIGG